MVEFEFNNYEIVERISVLAKKKGTALTPLSQKLGLSTSSFTEWRKGKAMPSLAAIATIAEYFDVTVDYLLFGDSKQKETDIYRPISGRERTFMMKFRLLPPSMQDTTLAYMEGMIAASSYDSDSEILEKRSLA